MSADVTLLLKKLQSDNREAIDELFPVVYNELRRLAAARLRDERLNHTLQPTALVHEAYLRLVEQTTQTWENRIQFFGLAAEMMRRILINHAVKRNAQKRSVGQTEIQLEAIVDYAEKRHINLMMLDDALNELAKIDPEQVKLIEFKFFTGLTNQEIAAIQVRPILPLNANGALLKPGWRDA